MPSVSSYQRGPVEAGWVSVGSAPYHGLVQGGTLTLPTGGQMPCPQPASSDTFRLALKGAPGDTRRAKVIAADKALGKWAAAQAA